MTVTKWQSCQSITVKGVPSKHPIQITPDTEWSVTISAALSDCRWALSELQMGPSHPVQIINQLSWTAHLSGLHRQADSTSELIQTEHLKPCLPPISSPQPDAWEYIPQHHRDSRWTPDSLFHSSFVRLCSLCLILLLANLCDPLVWNPSTSTSGGYLSSVQTLG